MLQTLDHSRIRKVGQMKWGQIAKLLNVTKFSTSSFASQVVGSHVLAAVICGGDSGVKMTDALSEVLQLQGNGTLSEGHRRDKLLQQEAVKAAGLRFARTMGGTNWEEARNWGEV